MKKLFTKVILAAGLLLVGGGNVWAEDIEWETVWSADFSTAPSGMTYSVANGSTNINAGYLEYVQGGGSGNRAVTTTFTADAFNVDTAWKMEFDIAFSSSNQNPSDITFSTNEGSVFKCAWTSYASAVVVTDASDTELTSTLPLEGYNKSTMNNKTHVIMIGDPENGVYLTMTQGATTYVDNVLATSTFGYPRSLNGSLGRAVSHLMLDNVVFQTPKVEGFVAAPTYQVIGANGVSRILTLSTITENSSIKWSETAPAAEEDFSAWTTYSTSLSTSASTIYAVAINGSNTSEVSTIETGAGSVLPLANPTVSVVLNNGVPTYSFDCNNAGVLGAPVASFSATLNGTPITMNGNSVTPTEEGSLVVTASAAGYASTSKTLPVATHYAPAWTSTDYSTLTEDNAQSVLGDNWNMSTGGRWASWNAGNEPYTYFTDGGNGNITVEDNLRMRGVISLVMGYGLGRNITGAEAITMNGMQPGYIAGYKMYNGYGSHSAANANYTTYIVSEGTSTSVNTNNGALLMQATIYAPCYSKTTGDTGYITFSATEPVTVPAGAVVYTSSIEGDVVTVEPSEATVIPANTGVVVKGEPNTEYTFVQTAAAGEAIATALTAAPNGVEGNGSTIFGLVKNEMEFAIVNDGVKLANNSAYLELAASARVRMVVKGDATGIENVNAAETTSVAYNLAGQRVNAQAKGIVIMNGKKFINK